MAIVRTRLISFTMDRVASLRKIRLGNESDNMVERLRFALPVIAEHQTATLVITGRADLVRLNYDDENGYYVDLTAEIVGPDGETEAYVRIDGDAGEAWSSNPFRLITGELPDVDEEIEHRFPGAVETMLTEIEMHRNEMQDMESRDDELSYQIRAFSPDFTVSGAAPTCTPLAGDPLNVVSQIEIRQEGSGDPSPNNVRPIVRHSQVSLTITDDEGQRVVTHELATPVIRGSYNWATGEARSDVRIRDVGAAAAVNTGTSSTGIRYVNTHNGGVVPTQLLACNRYRVTTSLPTESGYIRIVGGSIYIYDNAIDFDNPSAAYAGTEVVEPAAETVVQDTPTEVLAGKGVNTIVSSTGDTEVSGKGVLDVYSKKEIDAALDMLAGAVQEVDETLTKSGAAADAAVVGEKISELSEEIETLKEEGGISGGTSTSVSSELITLDCDEGSEIVVDGETAEAVTLVHCGKNLLPKMDSVVTRNGVTITPNEDGSITLNGTYTGTSTIWPDILSKETPIYLPAGTYTFSATNATDDTPISVQAKDASFDSSMSVGHTYPQRTGTLENGAYVFCYITIKAGASYDNVVIHMQLEAGTKATAYEPHSKEVLNGVVLPTTLTAHDGTNNIYTETGDVLTATTRKSVATIIDEVVEKKLAVDWSAYGLPVLALDGDCKGMTKDDYVQLATTFPDKDGNVMKVIAEVAKQGSSSMTIGVEIGGEFDTELGGLFNLKIKFPEAFEAVDGWGAHTKYYVKVYAIDHSHLRDVGSQKHWADITRSRSDAPEWLTALPNCGAIDGFPVIIVINGEYYALGSFNIPKDGWMAGEPEAILSAKIHCAATQFKAPATLDGDFELEYIKDEADQDWVLPSINAAIQAVMNSDGTDLDTVGQYIDFGTAMDHMSHCVDEDAGDCTDKNYLLVCRDRVKWFIIPYDKDTLYGLHWTGKSFSSPVDGLSYASFAELHALMGLIYNYKRAELKARAIELREGVTSEAHVATLYTNLAARIPSEVLAQNAKRWPLLRSTNAANLAQLLNWYRLRRAHVDKEIDSWTV